MSREQRYLAYKGLLACQKSVKVSSNQMHFAYTTARKIGRWLGQGQSICHTHNVYKGQTGCGEHSV